MADGGSTLGLLAHLKGQLQELQPAKDSSGKESGKFAKIAWFGGAHQLKLSDEQARRVQVSKFYHFEIPTRNVTMTSKAGSLYQSVALGFECRLVGECDASGNPIK